MVAGTALVTEVLGELPANLVGILAHKVGIRLDETYHDRIRRYAELVAATREHLKRRGQKRAI